MKNLLKEKNIITYIFVALVIISIIIATIIITKQNLENHTKKEEEVLKSQEQLQNTQERIKEIEEEREEIEKKYNNQINFLNSLDSESATKNIIILEKLGYRFNYRKSDAIETIDLYNTDLTVHINYSSVNNNGNIEDMTFYANNNESSTDSYRFYKNYYTDGLDDNLSNSENGFELYSNWLKEMNITQDELINLLFCIKLMEYKTN